MGKVYKAITDGVRAWVDAQPMFFVSTAPLAADGHVNSSPRGHDALRILGPHRLTSRAEIYVDRWNVFHIDGVYQMYSWYGAQMVPRLRGKSEPWHHCDQRGGCARGRGGVDAGAHEGGALQRRVLRRARPVAQQADAHHADKALDASAQRL